nr:hypothetical protein [Deltaproteobacteria bacterium]
MRAAELEHPHVAALGGEARAASERSGSSAKACRFIARPWQRITGGSGAASERGLRCPRMILAPSERVRVSTSSKGNPWRRSFDQTVTQSAKPTMARTNSATATSSRRYILWWE